MFFSGRVSQPAEAAQVLGCLARSLGWSSLGGLLWWWVYGCLGDGTGWWCWLPRWGWVKGWTWMHLDPRGDVSDKFWWRKKWYVFVRLRWLLMRRTVEVNLERLGRASYHAHCPNPIEFTWPKLSNSRNRKHISKCLQVHIECENLALRFSICQSHAFFLPFFLAQNHLFRS